MRLLFALCLVPILAGAAPLPHTQASVIAETDSYAPGKPFRIGLSLTLAPGWHTYWQNPGDAGAPPTIEVTGAKAGPIQYPLPARMRDGPFTSFAYTGTVLLPVAVTPPAAAAGPLHLAIHATWLACATVCIPEEGSFALDLPQGSAAPGNSAPRFAATDTLIPRPSPYPAHLAPDGTLWLAAPIAPRQAAFYPDEPGAIDQGAPQTLTTGNGIVRLSLKPLKPLPRLAGVLALTDAGGQITPLAVEATPAPLPGGAGATTTLIPALVLAFLGGLILNLMPCVLPILALKALSLARLSGAARREVRQDALAYTGGVTASFLAIGAALLGLRAAGLEAGWGTQFHSPVFTTAMAFLLMVMGLSLSGVFELGASLAGAGQGFARRGAFATGMLAVLVATPCTAPFMGTALAAALALPAAAGLLIFAFLGFGLAAPYAVLALAPSLANRFPRPGAWMLRLKQLLAFPVYGAAAWLLWVTAQLVPPAGFALALTGLVLAAFAAWAFGARQAGGGVWLLPASGLAGLAALLTIAAGGVSPAPRAQVQTAETFSPDRLAALRAQGRPVFVDMTAAWCITCQVNERVALSPASVQSAFSAHHVAYLRGDWTREDPAITRFLSGFGRSGVPLYVFYAPGHEAEVLPQILTEGEVLRLTAELDHAPGA